MPAYVFNDLSLGNWISEPQHLRNMLRDLCKFHTLACEHGHTAYLHKNGLYDCTVCGRAFREAVNAYSDREQKRRIYRLIDTARPSLPEDSAIPEGCRFSFQDRPIPRTGLAECAYLCHMQEAAFSYSLAGSDFAVTPLHVGIEAGTVQSVQTIGNFFSLDEFAAELAAQPQALTDWQTLLERAAALPGVRLEPSVAAHLGREPFERSLAEAVLRRLKVVSKMVGAASQEEFFELEKNFCHGEQAPFSEESDSKIAAYRAELTFLVRGQPQVCAFHGKIRGRRQFRIHMDGKPSRGKEVSIVYIGYKITRD